MEVKDFVKLTPEQQKIYIDAINTNIEALKTARLHAANERVAAYQEAAQEKHRNRDKTAAAYNLMALLSGEPVIQARDDDVIVPTNRDDVLRMHSGSTTNSNSIDGDKVSKSYELMQLLSSRGRAS